MSLIKIIKTDDHEAKRARHAELMNSPEGENEDYKRITNQLEFPVGKKLFLEIEITDSELSSNLFNFLHGNIEGQELLGFKINEIRYPERNHIVQIIDHMIMQLQQAKENIKF